MSDVCSRSCEDAQWRHHGVDWSGHTFAIGCSVIDAHPVSFIRGWSGVGGRSMRGLINPLLSASGSLPSDHGPLYLTRGFASRPPLEARPVVHPHFRPGNAPADAVSCWNTPVYTTQRSNTVHLRLSTHRIRRSKGHLIQRSLIRFLYKETDVRSEHKQDSARCSRSRPSSLCVERLRYGMMTTTRSTSDRVAECRTRHRQIGCSNPGRS